MQTNKNTKIKNETLYFQKKNSFLKCSNNLQEGKEGVSKVGEWSKEKEEKKGSKKKGKKRRKTKRKSETEKRLLEMSIMASLFSLSKDVRFLNLRLWLQFFSFS
jgi:hypothetical protein